MLHECFGEQHANEALAPEKWTNNPNETFGACLKVTVLRLRKMRDEKTAVSENRCDGGTEFGYVDLVVDRDEALFVRADRRAGSAGLLDQVGKRAEPLHEFDVQGLSAALVG